MCINFLNDCDSDIFYPLSIFVRIWNWVGILFCLQYDYQIVSKNSGMLSKIMNHNL